MTSRSTPPRFGVKEKLVSVYHPQARFKAENTLPWTNMRNRIRVAFLFALTSAAPAVCQMKGVLLEDLTWVEAESVLRPDTIVVIPIGAESKEHGPHLRLKNDFVLA